MTARQTIPRITTLLGQLKPTFSVADVRQINEAFLTAENIEGLIWDVDGTLMTYHAMRIAEPLAAHVEGLLGNSGLRHAVLSNCDELRFEELKRIFPNLPLIRGYKGPAGTTFRTAHGTTDSHTRSEIDKLLRSGYRQIRKPSGELIEHAVEILGLPGNRCVMIGDQYLTDIASANVGGIRSIKVETYGRKTFPRSIRFSQRLERVLFRLVNPRH